MILGHILMFFCPKLIFLIKTLSKGFAATLWLRGTTQTESRDVHVNGSGWFCKPLLIKSSTAKRTPFPPQCGYTSPCPVIRDQQDKCRRRARYHRQMRTQRQLCMVFSSLMEGHWLSHRFSLQNIYFLVF